MSQGERIIRKNMRISQDNLDRARQILGTRTETETVDAALDMIAFRQEALTGVRRIAGSRGMRDVYAEEEPAGSTPHAKRPRPPRSCADRGGRGH